MRAVASTEVIKALASDGSLAPNVSRSGNSDGGGAREKTWDFEGGFGELHEDG
jgi:hypothetical protein